MTLNKGYVYLSAADRQLASYIENDSFDRSLLMNLLFQPGVIIPDIFFFISRAVRQHLDRSTRSLLEAGLARGDIIPAFRDPSIDSFTRAWEVITGDGDPSKGISGVLPGADETAARLDRAARKGKNFSPVYWPRKSLAGNYQTLAVRLLTNDEPPELNADWADFGKRSKELWKKTERWRRDCVEAAIKKGGLRRGDLMTEVGRSLNVLPPGGKIDDVKQLFGKRVPSQERDALYYFCRWITDIYHHNQSDCLDAMCSFPSYRPLEGLMVTQLARESQGLNVPAFTKPPVSIEVKMPRESWLAKLSPEKLLDIKDNFNGSYIEELTSWQNHRRSSEEKLRSVLEAYGDKLSYEVRKEGGQAVDFLTAVFGSRKDIDQTLISTLGSASSWALPSIAVATQHPAIAVYSSVFGLGYQLFRIKRHRQPDSTIIELGTPEMDILRADGKKRRAEINILQSRKRG